MIIKLGDKNEVHANKRGTVQLNGVKIEAFFVPEFRISLLSVSQLDSYGLSAVFKDGVCAVINTHGQQVLGAALDRGLYILATNGSAHTTSAMTDRPDTAMEGSEPTQKHRKTRRSDSIEVWHRRFAHLNYADLKLILDSDKSDKFKSSWKIPELCEMCVQTKQQQRVIRTKSSRSSTPFELVHSDLCGPIKYSIGGAQFYIIYIDDCTRYTEVYFLITKSAEEISAKFQIYHAWIKARGFKIKRFRCDNGSGEYNNTMFLGILGENGITYEPSPPYTQHKNGVAERMIRTLNTKARSMMQDANVPIQFWPEAIRTACYLHRRSPTSSLSGNRSPHEALFGAIPQIEHLRRFGCRVFKHVPPAQRTEKKFGSRSNMCMLLGYVHDTTKIWRIWDFNSGRNGRAVECSSVVFQEEENAFGKGKEEQTDAIEFPEQTEKIHVIEDSPNPQGKSKRKGFLPPCPYPDQCSEEKMPEEYLSMRQSGKYLSGKIDAFL
jgi:transposase InsO family protein